MPPEARKIFKHLFGFGIVNTHSVFVALERFRPDLFSFGWHRTAPPSYGSQTLSPVMPVSHPSKWHHQTPNYTVDLPACTEATRSSQVAAYAAANGAQNISATQTPAARRNS
jgi:hypothetical protein